MLQPFFDTQYNTIWERVIPFRQKFEYFKSSLLTNKNMCLHVIWCARGLHFQRLVVLMWSNSHVKNIGAKWENQQRNTSLLISDWDIPINVAIGVSHHYIFKNRVSQLAQRLVEYYRYFTFINTQQINLLIRG